MHDAILIDVCKPDGALSYEGFRCAKFEFFIFISLYGNITVPVDLPELNGIIYAPNKNKTVQTYNTNFNGSIVADRVLITGGNKTIRWANYLSGGSNPSGEGKKTVHLVK